MLLSGELALSTAQLGSVQSEIPQESAEEQVERWSESGDGYLQRNSVLLTQQG